MGRFALICCLAVGGLARPGARRGHRGSESALACSSAWRVWLSVFLTTLVPFDFRGDIDRMATLKSLPIAPWRLALGQLLTPTLVLAAMQWLAVAVCAAVAAGALADPAGLSPPTFRSAASCSWRWKTCSSCSSRCGSWRRRRATSRPWGGTSCWPWARSPGSASPGSRRASCGAVAYWISEEPWVGVAAAWPVRGALRGRPGAAGVAGVSVVRRGPGHARLSRAGPGEGRR